nr:MAG TPA: Sigma non-opioid intracellular receptor 1 protein, Receptor, sigma-1 receptor [Caudoviricetes sp.]
MKKRRGSFHGVFIMHCSVTEILSLFDTPND